MKQELSQTKKAVYLGRFCPVHLGHEQVIREMAETHGDENCLILIGSANAPLTLRNFFSHKERRDFIRKIFPNIRTVGLPDYPDSMSEWYASLDDVLALAFSGDTDVTFWGGCEEDVFFFIDDNRKINLLNRFDGTTPKISATEIRDCLVSKRSLDGLVNPLITKEVEGLFAEKWEKFKKM